MPVQYNKARLQVSAVTTLRIPMAIPHDSATVKVVYKHCKLAYCIPKVLPVLPMITCYEMTRNL